MEKEISIGIIRKHINECVDIIATMKLQISEIDEENLTVKVRFPSCDGKHYLLSVQFDNYPKWPPYLDFIDEETGDIEQSKPILVVVTVFSTDIIIYL
jgi:hypothetical protein